MRRLLVVGIALLCLSACATAKPRHYATVSAVAAHVTLAAVQDTEMLLVCGKAGAPEPPACIPPEKHREISAKLVTAFAADIQVAQTIRDWPGTSAAPANIAELLAQIANTINYILAQLPPGPLTSKLQLLIGGVK